MAGAEIFCIIFGLFIGFIIIYITVSSPKNILKYPTIENMHKTIYIDENGVCYKYYAKEIQCETH